MKKLNKKGFTLIEMLVVIAIIAVLVAIIIPVVTAATDRAAAASNAANLRSIKAEVTTAVLADSNTGNVTITESNGVVTAVTYDDSDISWKDCSSATSADETGLVITVSGNTYTCKYNGLTINEWAALAD